MGDVIDAAVGLTHAFDGDRAMGFENMVVSFAVDLPFRRDEPLRLVKQALDRARPSRVARWWRSC